MSEKMDNIKGNVVRGIQKGRTLGFPTANIKVDLDLDAGIYAGHIFVDDNKYSAALYSNGDKIIEAFIFDFSGDLYGKEVSVELIKKIRDKKHFINDAEAIEQITKDVLAIKEYLSK